MKFEIRPFLAADIPILRKLQPADWGDITPGFRYHINQPYFIGIKVLAGQQIIGVGQLIMNAQACWLGNIITHPDFRRQGIGTLITKELIRIGETQGAHSTFLLATESGAPLYQTMGFESLSSYLFFRHEQLPKTTFSSPHIRQATANDQPQILRLDQVASGEDRRLLLQRHFDRCLVYVNAVSEVDGFYMPELGDGLIIAQTQKAGLQLFEKRQSTGNDFVCIPEQNAALIEKLETEGYTCFRKILLMKIGAMKAWQPKMIYGRIRGNIG